MSRLTMKTLAVMFMLVLATPAVLAQEERDPNAKQPVAADLGSSSLPLWEAGFFGMGITQPAYPGAEENVSMLLGLPFLVYRGEYLRIDRGTVGLRAIKTPRAEVDIGLAASLGSRADDIQVRHGMADLGALLEFGPRLNINIGDSDENMKDSRIQFPVRFVFDANDHFRYKGISYELQWVKDMKLKHDWLLTTNVGAVFGDQKLVDTFYRVVPAEATATRPAYDATSGLISLRASLFASRLITPDWRILGYLRVDSVDGAANHDSPLVRRDVGWSFGLGMALTLSQSGRIGSD